MSSPWPAVGVCAGTVADADGGYEHDPDLAERCCVDHVKAAALAALSMIERSSATRETAAVDG